MPITLIIATRDNGTDLQRFVDSLYATASTPEALRFLVIDNGSRQEETCRILADLAIKRAVRVLTLDEPFNWSHLNNRAVAEVETALIVFANDDMVMLSQGWDDVLRGLLDRTEVGAVGAKLLYPDDTIQSGGILFGWPGAPIHDGLYASRYEPGPTSRFRVTRATAATDGAFLATRRSAFLQYGPFDDTGMPVNYSDIDYALKLRSAGLRVLWTPEITAYHQQGKSRGLDHVDPEKQARQAAERAVLRARWGSLLDQDPSLNPIWHQATLPFRLLSAPSQDRLWQHIRLCAATNPWLPATAGADDRAAAAK
jgi:GT2 family glycosyltransferase